MHDKLEIEKIDNILNMSCSLCVRERVCVWRAPPMCIKSHNLGFSNHFKTSCN